MALAGASAALAVALSSAPRLALAAGSLPDALRPFVWSDLQFGYETLLAGGRVPYFTAPFYYPPGIGYLAGLFSIVSRDAVGYAVLWTVVVAGAAAAVGVLLAREAGTGRAIAFWSLSPQLILLSGANVDAVPSAFMLGAVLLSRRARPFPALALLAAGTVMKVFPAVIAPLEVLRTARASFARAAFGAAFFIGSIGLIALPSLIAPWPSTLAAPDYARLANIDSVWGLAQRLLIVSGVADAEALILVITTAGALATYLLLVVPRATRSVDPAMGAALAVTTMLLWTRLYSPQYALWLLPLLALVGIGRARYALLTIADILVVATIYPLTLEPWASGDPRAVSLLGAVSGAVVLRQVALVRIWLDVAARADRDGRGPLGPT